MWMFYVPVPKGKGREIAGALLEAKACKCVNIVSSRSLYDWKGKIEEQDEDIMIIKTTHAEAAEKMVRKLHPYDTPAILRLNLEANNEYEEWLKTR